MTNIFKGKSFFAWNVPALFGGDPVKIALWLIAHGFTSIIVKAADGGYIFYPSWSAFPNWLTSMLKLGRANVDKNFVDVLHSYGLLVFGWGFNYGRDPEAEGKVAAEQCNALGLDGWVVDIESEFENRSSAIGDAGKFIGKFRQYIIKPVPLAYCGWAEFFSPKGVRWHNIELAKFFMGLPEFTCGIPMFYWDSYDAAGKPIPTPGIVVQSELRNILKQWGFTGKAIMPAGRAYTGDGGIASVESILAFGSLARELCAGATYWVMDQAIKMPTIVDALGLTPGWNQEPTPVPVPVPEPIPTDPVPTTPLYTGKVRFDVTLGLNVRSTPPNGTVLTKLAPFTSFEGDEGLIASDGKLWIHITKPTVGWIASWWTDYIENGVHPIPLGRPAIPGPIGLPSDGELLGGDITKAFDIRFPTGALDAYPAIVIVEETWMEDGRRKFGRGQIAYNESWMIKLKQRMTPKQWNWFWGPDAGIHNNTDKVEMVTTAHNVAWAESEDEEYYYLQCYYNDEPAPDILNVFDPFRMHYVTVMHRTLNKENGGIFYPDCGKVPYPLIITTKTRQMRVKKKLAKSLATLPLKVKVKTGGDQLNVRSTPSSKSEILAKRANGTEMTVFSLKKVGNEIWGRITEPGSIDGWVAMWYTDWRVPMWT